MISIIFLQAMKNHNQQIEIKKPLSKKNELFYQLILNESLSEENKILFRK